MGQIWNAVTNTYHGILHTLGQGGFPGMAWFNFEQGVREYLGWADLTASSKLRYRVTKEITELPEPPLKSEIILPGEPVAPALEIVAQNNPWFAEHKHITDPLVAQRAEWVRATEERYWNGRRALLNAYFKKGPKKVKIEPLARLDMHRRTAHGVIANVSEQVQMAVPEISDAFPFAEYFTRDDRRVRPTHVPMLHFVAIRSWAGWPRIVPLNGFSCRCWLRYSTNKEAIERGYMTKDGLAKFEVKWPNSLARKNYEKGLFPDKGWAGPKYWQFPTPPIRVKK